jgi:hypothetical protein
MADAMEIRSKQASASGTCEHSFIREKEMHTPATLIYKYHLRCRLWNRSNWHPYDLPRTFKLAVK